MPKYLVETVSLFRIRYVVEAKNASDAKNEVTISMGEDFKEFSQLHIDESIISVDEIDTEDYLRLFDEDNVYLKDWDEEQKLDFVNVLNYGDAE